MRCPVCKIPTLPRDEGGVMETSCPQCHGIWVSQVALHRLMNYELAKEPPPDESLKGLAVTVARSNSTAQLYCPECHVGLLREQLHPMIPVQVDRCEKCNYVWFDAGEQRLLLRLYRELKSTHDAWLVGERDKVDRLEAVYQGPLPGFEKLDHEIGEIKDVVSVAAGYLGPGNAAQQWGASLAIGMVGRVVDWFLSFLMPTP